ncbi:MAG TPA: hypothetical protein VKR06_40280 [Ktedonosporobacter sp.]|nr:hypothetical protein [Ktedonosporobacter sp.]
MVTELMRIRRACGLTVGQLAELAEVPLRVEYLCEIGGWVEEEDARKVLNALSAFTGKYYSLETVSLNIKRKENEDDQEIAQRLPVLPRIARTA